MNGAMEYLGYFITNCSNIHYSLPAQEGYTPAIYFLIQSILLILSKE
jgi:hypothetical protein